MKHLLLLLTAAFALVCGLPAFGQSSQARQHALTQAQRGAREPQMLPAHALLDQFDSLVLSAWSGSLFAEGSTNDGLRTELAFADPTAARTITFPDASGVPVLSSALPGAAGSISFAASSLVAEGATADAHETTIAITDPTADRTVTVPNASGTVGLAQASTTVALTADAQAVTPGSATVIQFASDNDTAANRTATLSATGSITGQVYVLIGPATNQMEIAATGIQKLSATWSPTAADTLTLLFDGTNFLELARSDN